MALALDAPAKINLFLEVLRRRADGYHDVETVLHALELHDTLLAEAHPDGVELTIEQTVRSGLTVPTEDNLVCRAAQIFRERYRGKTGTDAGFRFHLCKRIPAGGGLGGGSSDAAAALRLMNTLHSFPLSDPELSSAAATLGADVPFFLRCGTQLGRDIGTQLTVLPSPHLYVALIVPPIGTSTESVYKNHRLDLTAASGVASIAWDKVPDIKEVALVSGFPNHLETTALALLPELAVLRDRVVALGYPGVRLSGSGSTFFLAFRESGACNEAINTLAPLRDEGIAVLRTQSNRGGQPEPRVVSWPDSG